MKQVIIICGILLLFGASVFSQGLEGKYYVLFRDSGPYVDSEFVFIGNTYEAKIFFDDDKIPSIIQNEVIYENGGWKYTERGSFNIIEDDKVFYIEWIGSKVLSRYGIIYDETEVLLYDRNRLVFWSGTTSKTENMFPRITNISASSELRENGITYSARNMLERQLPWVEGVNGYGIGESLTLTVQCIPNDYFNYPFTGFIISNGFVNFEHPDLYRKNSRAKIIEVIAPNGITKEYLLADTSLFQTIELPEDMIMILNRNIETFEYRIIIKDVYRGDLWEDTCINIIDTIVPAHYHHRNLDN